MNLAGAVSPLKKLQNYAENLKLDYLNAEMLDFAPGILKVQNKPPSPLPRMVLYGLLALFAVAVLWIIFGRLDIVAVAQGKLVPLTYVKIVQPAEAGIVEKILVKEGQEVQAGQILMRMDTKLADADSKAVLAEYQRRTIQLRRIDAEMANQPLTKQANDPADLYLQAESQYRANRQAYQDAIGQEQALLEKAREDLAAAREVQGKLKQTLPMYQHNEQAYVQLAKEGYAGQLEAADKSRERIEKEQDLRTQTYNIASLQASIAQSGKKLAQITSTYRQKLQEERVEALAQYQKLEQDWAKQTHKNTLLELKAPQAAIVKDLGTHTEGTVVSPGTVLMTLVPKDEQLQAEVWIENEDAGFMRTHQPVKVKILSYQFQKYGMVDGGVTYIGADASDAKQTNAQDTTGKDNAPPAKYRALINLKTQSLEVDGEKFHLAPGMQVTAEVKLGTRTILEYLLSPVQKAFHEAARER
jgi:hemolysin D